jgi:hypothetical protein
VSRDDGSSCQARGHVAFGQAARPGGRPLRAGASIATLLALAASALAALALAPAAGAAALECPAIPLEERIAEADAAFVGRLVSQRPEPGGERAYRFLVDQRVKGPLGREVELRAPRLTDASGTPIERDVAIGVLAERDGAAWTTGSCSLTDPGALLAAADEPKGGWIKLLIGLAILAAVLAYSVRRLRRRQGQLGGGPTVHGSLGREPPETRGR